MGRAHEIVSGLSTSIAGVLLTVVIDERSRTFRIVQHGSGQDADVQRAAMLLRGRIGRARPDLRMVEDV